MNIKGEGSAGGISAVGSGMIAVFTGLLAVAAKQAGRRCSDFEGGILNE